MKPQLHILARQPLAGHCKTRLQTHCNADQAAIIAAALLEETVAIAAHSWPGIIFLHGSPNQQHPLFVDLAKQYTLQLAAQKGSDLGQIQTNALTISLNTGSPAAVIGSDLPGLKGAWLQEACTRLKYNENVLGLSPDGGYYLLGVQYIPGGLLQNICWSSSKVSSQLLHNARHLHLQISTDLPQVNDVDTWQDLLAASAASPTLSRRLYDRVPELWQEITLCNRQ
ncbi:MAG TPA: DUF2064 domain-containing protein [Gammaproteobacteria bacterium]|nr:DUF2064 domain-containing protein [Gammaproteobacteria bacterium]